MRLFFTLWLLVCSTHSTRLDSWCSSDRDTYDCDTYHRTEQCRCAWLDKPLREYYRSIPMSGGGRTVWSASPEETLAYERGLHEVNTLLAENKGRLDARERKNFGHREFSDFLFKEPCLRKNCDLQLEWDLALIGVKKLIYPSPGFIEMFNTVQTVEAYQNHQQTEAKITDMMRKAKKRLRVVYDACLEKHYCLRTLYESGLLYQHEGEYQKSLACMESYVEEAKRLRKSPAVDDYRRMNELQQSTMQYEAAVKLLTEAITTHPDQKDLYIQRIAANFELGRSSDVAKDYCSNNFDRELQVDPSKSDLALAFIKGASKGCVEGIKEYPFTMLASLRGSGQLLWATVSDPIGTPGAMLEDIQNVMTALKADECTEILSAISPELGDLVKHWDAIDSKVRWEKAGYLFGKNGFDCLSFLGQQKIIDLFFRLRSTNVLCNVKTSFQSADKKARIVHTSEELAQKRKAFFESSKKIDMDKQGKHIEGHNSWKTLTPDAKKTYSLLTHKDPEALLQKGAGKGIPAKGGDPHEVGYRESYDFKETIGIWKSEDGKTAAPTTRGMIHYDTKHTAHIVPIEPGG